MTEELFKSLEKLKSLAKSQAYHSGKGDEWEESERLSELMKRSIRESDSK